MNSSSNNINSSNKENREPVVLSSRVKPIEETPTVASKEDDDADKDNSIESVLSLNKSATGSQASTRCRKKHRQQQSLAETLSRYLPEDALAAAGSSSISYPTLLRDEIAAADRALLAECRAKGQLGGQFITMGPKIG